MRTRGVKNIFLAAVLASVFLPRVAAAEPIVVTAGHVETQLTLGLARILFEGNDFFLQAGIEGFRSALALCKPCAPDGPLTLSGSFGPAASGSGPARVDGVTYETIFLGNVSGTFTTGAVTLSGALDQAIALPFTFSGALSGFSINPALGQSDPVFTKSLSGSGIASATFATFGSGGGLVDARDLRYDFSATSPVPEPATLLLVGAAFAFATRFRQRR